MAGRLIHYHKSMDRPTGREPSIHSKHRRTTWLREIMHTAGHRQLYSIMIRSDISRRRTAGQRDTWHIQNRAGGGDRKHSQSSQLPSTTPNCSIYVDRTCKLHVAIRSTARNLPAIIYISFLALHWSITAPVLNNQRSSICIIIQASNNQERAPMAGEGCRNQSANRDLQLARDMFERRTSQRNKRKIIDLEASAQEEESKLSDHQLSQEVDWLQDPGTTSTRATQFVRTQAEAWRMKTILAKAMDVQAEQAEQLRTLQQFAATMTKEHMAVVQSSEFKLTALHEEVDTISKKLTVLIKLLRKSIEQDSKPPELQRGGPSKVNQENALNCKEMHTVPDPPKKL